MEDLEKVNGPYFHFPVPAGSGARLYGDVAFRCLGVEKYFSQPTKFMVNHPFGDLPSERNGVRIYLFMPSSVEQNLTT